jgi:hypothetical protein
MMIIFRVAFGVAWSSNTASDVMKQSRAAGLEVVSVRSTSSTIVIGFSPYTSPVSEKGAVRPWTATSNEDFV